MTRTFTGRHMFAIMLAMFGTIVSVNVVMATLAVRTFGGTVVENSYVASQEFNGWLAAAREQRRLGWTVDVSADPLRHLAVSARAPGGPLGDATVSAVASHPLGRAPARRITFSPHGNGRFLSAETLPAGRWLLRIEIRQGGRTALFDDEIAA